MSDKTFHFDTETTGLNPYVHDIWQLAFLVEIDGKIVEEQNWTMQPERFDTVRPEALEVTGITIEELKTFEKPAIVFKRFIKFLDSHIDKYNKTDKFVQSGFNVKFDTDMLRGWFQKNNHKYYGSYFTSQYLDVMGAIFWLVKAEVFPQFENYKLKTICDALGIEIDAHEVLSDIKATKVLADVIKDTLKELT